MSPFPHVALDLCMPFYSTRQIKKIQSQRACGKGLPAKKKGADSMSMPSDTTVTPDTAYCPHDENINNTLVKLHSDLRNGVPNTQVEIDRYLFAAGPQIAKGIPPEHFILDHCQTPRFELLPNIQHRISRVLSIRNDDARVPAQFLRQCIPLKRRTKRAQREITWKEEDVKHMRIFIRCAYGTLLGLYPYCSKFTHFHNRVAINALLHTVLVSDNTTITKFCNTFSYILRLSTMEHACYTMETFAPSLAAALNKKRQFTSFTSTIYSVGDTFRGDINQQDLDASNLPETWKTLQGLDAAAQTLFDRCSRAFRTVITPPATHALTSQYRRNIANMYREDPDIISRIMRSYASPNKYLFGTINDALIPKKYAEDVWQLIDNVRVKELTAQITLKQLAKCYEMHPKDISLRQRQGVLQVCIICALKNNYCHNPCATRYDAVQERLTCVECQNESIVQINLLGRVLYIGNNAIVFSTCCMSPIIWNAHGFEWNDKCSQYCGKHGFQSHCTRRKKATAAPVQVHNHCFVCKSRTVTVSHTVVDLQKKHNTVVHFCNRHAPPQGFLKQTSDIREIREYLDANGN